MSATWRGSNRLSVLILALLSLSACGGGGETSDEVADAGDANRVLSTLKRYEIDAGKHPLARCNDGSTPLFVYMDQLDFKLGYPPADPGYEAAATAIRDLLAAQPAAFAPRTGKHVIVTTSRFNSTLLNGNTMADLVGNWYFNRPGPTVAVE